MILIIFHPMYLASKAAGNSFHTCAFYGSVLTPELFQLLGEIWRYAVIIISTKHAASEKKWSLTRNLDLKNNQKKLTPKSAKFSSDPAFVSSMGQLIDSDERDA